MDSTNLGLSEEGWAFEDLSFLSFFFLSFFDFLSFFVGFFLMSRLAFSGGDADSIFYSSKSFYSVYSDPYSYLSPSEVILASSFVTTSSTTFSFTSISFFFSFFSPLFLPFFFLSFLPPVILRPFFCYFSFNFFSLLLALPASSKIFTDYCLLFLTFAVFSPFFSFSQMCF